MGSAPKGTERQSGPTTQISGKSGRADTDEPRGGPSAERRHNLPHISSDFIGRRAEMAEVSGLLAESRLVTVCGAAGMGKTRLALRVAARAAPRFPRGVWLVELAPLTTGPDVAQAVASVLCLPEGPDVVYSAEELAANIGTQEVLIVLDNCEHLVDACAHLTEVLLNSCPALGILATSREPLGIAGEHVSMLGPMSLPDPQSLTAAAVGASDAAHLFAKRASATRPGFAVTDETAGDVSELCRRLDGMPLALELAAARLASLSLTEIVERLDDRLVVLTTGSRTAARRHRTLASALEWSYDLLTVPEARLLRRLSGFAGWAVEA